MHRDKRDATAEVKAEEGGELEEEENS